MSQRKIETMFDRYSRNWDQVKHHLLPPFSQLDDVVVCPICARVFNRSEIQELSLEHIPPRVLGGKSLTFTCRVCNNEAGSHLDAHLVKYVDFTGVLQGVSGSKVDATYVIDDGDFLLPATVMRPDERTWQLIGDPSRTKPGEIQKQLDKLKLNLNHPNFRLHLNPGFTENRSDIALLRIAYLWAFSVFGYWFLLNLNLEAVRQQIAQPDLEILPTHGIVERQFPDELLGVNLIVEPEHLRSIFVVVDLKNGLGTRVRKGITLPSHIAPASHLYAELMKYQTEHLSFDVTLNRMRDDFNFLEQPYFLHELWADVQKGVFKEE